MKQTFTLFLLLFASGYLPAQEKTREVQRDSIALLFDYNRSVILNSTVLETALHQITEPLSKIVLIGYTDSLGETADNRVLASKRINAVSEFLQRTKWSGANLEVSNVNESGGYPQTELTLNRRVDVLIYTRIQEKPKLVELNKPVNLNINFENASAVIRTESYANLEKLRDVLLQDSSLNVKLLDLCPMILQDLGGKTVITRTYQAAVKTNLFDDVFVVTDSILIYDEIISNGGKAIMSVKEHESGSDRISEAVENLDVDIVVNVQGDEPFINAEPLAKVLDVFRNDFDKKVDLASLMVEITDEEDINNPNNVKVVTDQSGFALYFSRSVIPYPREKNVGVRYMKHIGIYAFRK